MVERFIGDYQSIYKLWWFDQEKIDQLEDAMQNNRQLPVPEVDFKFWPEWNKKQ